ELLASENSLPFDGPCQHATQVAFTAFRIKSIWKLNLQYVLGEEMGEFIAACAARECVKVRADERDVCDFGIVHRRMSLLPCSEPVRVRSDSWYTFASNREMAPLTQKVISRV